MFHKSKCLDFSRIDAGKKEYTLAPVDLADVVRTTYDTYRVDLDQQGFQHTLTVADRLPRGELPRSAAAQICSMLCCC